MKRSTKTADRNQALEIAIEFERVERRAKHGNLTAAQIKKVLNDVSEKVTGDTLIAPSTAEYLNEWLEGVRARASASTQDRYKTTTKLFLAFLGDKAKKPITTITPRDAEGFMNSRLKAGFAPKTAIVDLKTINIAFRRAENYGVILKNPVAAVRPPKEVCSEREVFTHEEVQKLLGAAPSMDWQTLILLGYFTGARLWDCAQMSWENVKPDTGVIEYRQQKTDKKVTVPMHFNVIEHLKLPTMEVPMLILRARGFANKIIERGMNYTNRIGFGIWNVSDFKREFGQAMSASFPASALLLPKEAAALATIASLLFPDRLPLLLERIL